MNAQKTAPTAAMVIIGNEILSGRTQDKNLNYVAKRMADVGIGFREVRVIPDVEAVIIRTLHEMMPSYDYVFTSGGIGPTHDDITSETVAKALGLAWKMHPEAEAILRDYYKENITEARLRMAMMPEGVLLIPNPVSGAPGFVAQNLYVMAGVPSIMQAMLEAVIPSLRHGNPILSISVSALLPESRIAAAMAATQQAYMDIDIGSYPTMSDGHYATSVVLRGTDKARLEQAAEAIRAAIRSEGAEVIERDLSAA